MRKEEPNKPTPKDPGRPDQPEIDPSRRGAPQREVPSPNQPQPPDRESEPRPEGPGPIA